LSESIVAPETGEAPHVMRADLQVASRFESCALPYWTINEDLHSFTAEFRVYPRPG